MYTIGVKDTTTLICAKFDTSGNMGWATDVGSGGTLVATHGDTDSLNGEYLYATGYATGNTIVNNNANNDLFLTCLKTTDGSVDWSKYWGSSGDDRGKALAVSPDGGKILITG